MVAVSNAQRLFMLNYLKQMQEWSRRRNQLYAAIVLDVERRHKLIYKCLLMLKQVLVLLKQNMMSPSVRKPRSFRRFIRNVGWWETVSTRYSDDRFKNF